MSYLFKQTIYQPTETNLRISDYEHWTISSAVGPYNPLPPPQGEIGLNKPAVVLISFPVGMNETYQVNNSQHPDIMRD